jgi:hypothetical protein
MKDTLADHMWSSQLKEGVLIGVFLMRRMMAGVYSSAHQYSVLLSNQSYFDSIWNVIAIRA